MARFPHLTWGLDLGSNTGITEGIPGEKPKLYTARFARENDAPDEVFRRAMSFIAMRLVENVPSDVGIELSVATPFLKGKTNHRSELVKMGIRGIFIGALRCKGVRIHHCQINAWRAHFLGKGNGRLARDAAKEAAKARCRMLGWEYDSDDAAESSGIWDYMCSDRLLRAGIGFGLTG